MDQVESPVLDHLDKHEYKYKQVIPFYKPQNMLFIF